jgi:diadenosine tetraphosphate (Ap4A) HIT family hydrolase
MTTATETCTSCEIAAERQATPGGLIHSSQLFTLTHHGHVHHAMPGFLILQPRRHIEHIAEFSGEEAMEFGPLLKSASMALMNVCAPAKVYVCSFGSVIKHVHFYLIPQRDGMPNATELLEALAAGKYACTEEEAADVAARVRVAMTKLNPYYA